MSLLDLLEQKLSGGTVDRIGAELGTDRATTERAIDGAMPMLLEALKRNTTDQQGASSLLSALDRDHDGSVVDDLAGFFTGKVGVPGKAGDGAGILRHMLGGRREVAERGLSKASGIDSAKSGRLLEMLAPILMGALGKQKRERGLDAGGLQDLIRLDTRRVEERAPKSASIWGRLLDKDGDGQIMDDIAGAGANILGGLFKRH